MKIHGYCHKCCKIKRVRVNGPGLTRLVTRQVAIGVCDDCEQKERDRRGGH